jgi:hypothetical protein
MKDIQRILAIKSKKLSFLPWPTSIAIKILENIHRHVLFKIQLNKVLCTPQPHRKQVTSPLRAQQVNAIYRLVTMMY